MTGLGKEQEHAKEQDLTILEAGQWKAKELDWDRLRNRTGSCSGIGQRQTEIAGK